MGLISVILILMAGVGFLTFGFTEAVCGTPPTRFHGIGGIENTSAVIHGFSYNFANFKHPATGATFNGNTNPLTTGGWNLAGNDASFLFQITNQNCLGIVTKSSQSTITGASNFLDWYFPCNIHSQNGAAGVNVTGYETGADCHFSSKATTLFNQMMHPAGQVYYTWDDVKNPSRNLAVFESYVKLCRSF
jgi:chitin synthase